jgi:tryptophanyl-tRNA synthetase
MNKQRIFSGIQPSGNLHLGNYLGAIQNWVKLQDEFESIFCVVDLHAITVPQDPEALRRKTIEIAKIYLASGIDPKKSSIFIQSHIPEHSELAWILNTFTKMSDLFRMTQFKDKSGTQIDLEQAEKLLSMDDKSNDKLYIGKDVAEKITITSFIKNYINQLNKVGVGLFDYPVLMAADILLYDTEVVPVGEDQLQHIELARDLAKRFNKKFGETFIVPKHFIKEEGMRIMGLDDPTKKMSKSAASEYNYIALTDSEEIIRKKIKKAVTDSGTEIVYQNDKPALKNLINIYSLLSDKSTDDIEKMYVGKGYADFKADLADVVVNFLKPFQERLNAISDTEVLEILKAGAEKVRPLAQKKLTEVKNKVGFIA